MKMKKKLTYLLLLLLLPLLGGCDTEDNVLEIFTGKTWKLTYIALEGQHQMFDFWNENTDAAQRSLQLLEQGSTFIIEFNGSETADYVGGDFEAQAVNRSITGNWAANGASRELSLNNLRTSGSAYPFILYILFVTVYLGAQMFQGFSWLDIGFYMSGYQHFTDEPYVSYFLGQWLLSFQLTSWLCKAFSIDSYLGLRVLHLIFVVLPQTVIYLLK